MESIAEPHTQNEYFVAKERAYRHTVTHYAYSCSVDWQGAVMAGSDRDSSACELLSLDVFREVIFLLCDARCGGGEIYPSLYKKGRFRNLDEHE